MNANKKIARLDTGVRISLLWIVVMLNMAFADICSFILPGALDGAPFVITQEIMLVFAIMLEIPIAMIYLSRVLKHNANRWVNTVASAVTIVYVIAGGSSFLHYYFFAAIEVVCMLVIIWTSWKRLSPEGTPDSQKA